MIRSEKQGNYLKEKKVYTGYITIQMIHIVGMSRFIISSVVFSSLTACHNHFTFDSWQLNATDVNQRRRALMKWETLSKAEKYGTEMQEVPFNLSRRVCLALDIYRFDGKDVREFARIQNIPFSEFARLERIANIQRTTTTSVILQRTPGITVGDLVNILKQMGRQDIVDLINEW